VGILEQTLPAEIRTRLPQYSKQNCYLFNFKNRYHYKKLIKAAAMVLNRKVEEHLSKLKNVFNMSSWNRTLS